jgi:hypothetical protein
MSGYRRHTKALITARTTATITFTAEALELGILLLGMPEVDTTVEADTTGAVDTMVGEGTAAIARNSIVSVFGARFLHRSWNVATVEAYASRV